MHASYAPTAAGSTTAATLPAAAAAASAATAEPEKCERAGRGSVPGWVIAIAGAVTTTSVTAATAAAIHQ